MGLGHASVLEAFDEFFFLADPDGHVGFGDDGVSALGWFAHARDGASSPGFVGETAQAFGFLDVTQAVVEGAKANGGELVSQ